MYTLSFLVAFMWRVVCFGKEGGIVAKLSSITNNGVQMAIMTDIGLFNHHTALDVARKLQSSWFSQRQEKSYGQARLLIGRATYS